MSVRDPYYSTRSELIRSLDGRGLFGIAQAVSELGRRGSRRDIGKRVIQLLAYDDEGIVTAAAEASGKLGLKAAIPILVEIMTDDDRGPGVRETAAYALGLVADARSLPALLDVHNRTADAPECTVLHRCSAEAAKSVASKSTK